MISGLKMKHFKFDPPSDPSSFQSFLRAFSMSRQAAVLTDSQKRTTKEKQLPSLFKPKLDAHVAVD
jgi:hypothetical protein